MTTTTRPTTTDDTGDDDTGDDDTEPVDTDGDGWTVAEGDCDDNDAAINPDAVETWDDGQVKWHSDTTIGSNYSTIALADLDQDGTAEVIAHGSVFSHEGLLEWSVTHGSTVCPSVADVDGDGFTGMIRDDTLGLSYVQQRWYDAWSGVFCSRDPIAGDPTAPLTLHPWLYGRGDPVHYLDPTGEFSLMEMSSVITMMIGMYTAFQITAALHGLKHAMQAIYGQQGYEPMVWKGPMGSAGISFGMVGFSGQVYSPRVKNDAGQTSATVLFALAGMTLGSKGGVSSGPAEFETWNIGQEHMHPEWPMHGKPNPYPLEGLVIQTSLFSWRVKNVFAVSALSQTSVFNGIRMTAFSWGAPDLDPTPDGSVGGAIPDAGDTMFKGSFFDIFAGKSDVASSTGP